MKKSWKTLVVVTGLGAIALAAVPALADPGHGWSDRTGSFQTAQMGMRGGFGNMMGGYGPGAMMGGNGPGAANGGYGHGAMMGAGYGPQMMGVGQHPCAGELDLSADDVKAGLENRLTASGNKRLKVGEVTKKDDDTYVATIVTQDNSLVERLEIDRTTGFTRSVE